MRSKTINEKEVTEMILKLRYGGQSPTSTKVGTRTMKEIALIMGLPFDKVKYLIKKAKQQRNEAQIERHSR